MMEMLGSLGLDSSRVVISLVGSFVGASCALVGTFLVLRKMAMLGDAISHAVLPGIAIAFLLSGDRQPLPMLLGAGALGVVTVVLVGALNRTRRLREDAAIGVVFPALFSIGVILMTRYLSDVHLDVDCVLHGEIALAPYDELVFGGQSFGPKALWVTGGLFVVNLVFVIAFYKELKITSFDPQLAAAIGLSPVVMHYLLMTSVSVTVVGCFESVGAILVVAMLVVPPATAHLLTDNLGRMLLLSVLLGVGSALTGYALAAWWDCSIAGAMAVAAGGFFAVALVFSPRYGLLSRIVFRRTMARRFREHLVLLHLRHEERATSIRALAIRFNWHDDELSGVVAKLEVDHFVARSAEGLRLTALGLRRIESAGIQSLRHREP